MLENSVAENALNAIECLPVIEELDHKPSRLSPLAKPPVRMAFLLRS
jgi:hypothetical protein